MKNKRYHTFGTIHVIINCCAILLLNIYNRFRPLYWALPSGWTDIRSCSCRLTVTRQVPQRKGTAYSFQAPESTPWGKPCTIFCILWGVLSWAACPFCILFFWTLHWLSIIDSLLLITPMVYSNIFRYYGLLF